MVEQLFKELSLLEEVESIALGGSRAGKNYDKKSDYDVYLYINSTINEEKRKNILKNSVVIWRLEIVSGNMKTTVF